MRAIVREVEDYCEQKGKFFHCWNPEGTVVDEEDGWVLYTEFETDLPPEDVQHLFYEMRDAGYGRMACGHSHDCCGCSFLSSWSVFSTFPRHSGIEQAHGRLLRTVLVKESWGINV